jgi:2-deoxy-D-gluconate 3-dehydrogenase
MNSSSEYLRGIFGLSGKVTLVTGGSGGIGGALAHGLSMAGAIVALSGRSEAHLTEARQRVEADGGKAITLLADLADPASCQRLIADTHAALGRLDILVNCAGMNRRKPIDQVGDEDYDTIMKVNLRSAYFLSRAVHPIMRGQGGGKIVHIASLTSSIALAGTSVYGMSKAALAQLAKTQAVEWAKDNIQVNCLAPGFVQTPLTDEPLWQNEKRRRWLLERIPAARPGKPDDMVAAVLLMTAPGSSYLTGQMITVDGGFLAGGSWDA